MQLHQAPFSGACLLTLQLLQWVQGCVEQVLHPTLPAAGSDKISRSGWRSTAWPVRAGSWTATPLASRRVTGHHPGHSPWGHVTWAIASKDGHLSKGNSALSYGGGRDCTRHSQVLVSLSGSHTWSQCHFALSSSPTCLLLPTVRVLFCPAWSQLADTWLQPEPRASILPAGAWARVQ